MVGLFGLIAVFLVPPAVTFDGPSHYFRALQLSRGGMRAVVFSDTAAGGSLPDSHRSFVLGLWQSYWADHDFGTLKSWAERSRKAEGSTGIVHAEFTNTAVYSPFNYLFQALGMRLAALFSRSPLIASRAGCLANLVGYLALIAVATALLPRFREATLLLATTPLIVFQAASLSADPVNFLLPVILFAWIWKLRSRGSRRPRLEVGLVFALGLGVVLLKPVAIVALGALLFVPAALMGGVRIQALVLGGYFVGALGLWFAWNHRYMGLDIARWIFPWRAPIAGQRHWFYQDPRRILPVFSTWFRTGILSEWKPLYSNVGGWIPGPTYLFLQQLSLVFLVAFVACPTSPGSFDPLWSIGLVFLGIVWLLVTGLSLYLTFGTPADSNFFGFSGRYMMVPLWCFALALSNALPGRLRALRWVLFWTGLAANAVGLAAVLISIGRQVA